MLPLRLDDAKLPAEAQKGCPSKGHRAYMRRSAEAHVGPEVFGQALRMSVKVGVIDACNREDLHGELAALMPTPIEAAP